MLQAPKDNVRKEREERSREWRAWSVWPQAREYGSHQKREKARDGFSPSTSADTWFPPSDTDQIFGLQKWRKINLHCYKLPSWWSFVRAAIGIQYRRLPPMQSTPRPFWSKSKTPGEISLKTNLVGHLMCLFVLSGELDNWRCFRHWIRCKYKDQTKLVFYNFFEKFT